MLRFTHLDKNKFEMQSQSIFAILAGNMSRIAPTGNTYENDYKSWFEAVDRGLAEKSRQMILICFADTLIGFFQYYVNNELFMMEEIQIVSQWQGKQIFRKLHGFIFTNLPDDIKIVEAYANKQNQKSQGILQKLGLENIGENKNGNCYHYRGTFQNLLNWYQNY